MISSNKLYQICLTQDNEYRQTNFKFYTNLIEKINYNLYTRFMFIHMCKILKFN